MKNKAPLALIEQVIMLLVLAIVSAICLQVFLKANEITRESHAHDLALEQLQNTAEALQSTGGDLNQTAAIVGGTVENGHLTVEAEDYTITLEERDSDQPLLGTAKLTATRNGKVLSQLEVCWQEVTP